MIVWKWDAELGASRGGAVFNVGRIGPFTSDADAEAGARAVFRCSVDALRERPDYVEHRSTVEGWGVTGDYRVTGATIQRWHGPGRQVDWDGRRDIR
ncbi:Uncharacterised protein (plasmid) [Tsukamurella tyrosinosolvens]|uniref:Uncharacterized protein n=1 Tax=Tsukamurella tyrosinosolvens TaxID=57704 RepID=A0A1H4V3K3_TSUTY|nr:hypothetical protein [Tsukamurella tyrosinosolvens]KXO91056.1 hypothetical protein AXK58_21740 [Tsukamurella tyrosinosolvens]SEC75692.1 hypothetical protein SAMN04489793_3133 [Tsukamurella tyrosinosolvens]VEH90698.1 Uncharacterised protein [Tsukamurella tyrosinosolvens]